MNKNLQKLHVTAKDIGFCLVCGGENGNCSCFFAVDAALPDVKRWAFVDVREPSPKKGRGQDRTSAYFVCFRSHHIVCCFRDSDLVRCECGVFLKHVITPTVIPEPDYSILEGLSDLPTQARRKPKIYRSRNRPGSGNG